MSLGKRHTNVKWTADSKSDIAVRLVDNFNVREKIVKVWIAGRQYIFGQINHDVVLSQREHRLIERRGLQQNRLIILSNVFFAKQQNRFRRFECLKKHDQTWHNLSFK